ncbi:phospho-sugar mutase [Salinibacterium sp.]|uniref:phospho-sugar mutase n=1 Tax=Salinibacterium sp. TaxID=1915057 RepID=UPI00286D09CA|nr:phospho-sugar mutase [Salinibacterium sp.]
MTVDAASAGLLAAANSWRDQDPDATSRAELDDLVTAAAAGDAHAHAALADRFSARLEFGTAGLRGELGAGPRRMNRVLVTQAAAGLAAYLLARDPHPSIVIGYDGRRNSEVFARDTATIMAGAGVTTTLLPRHLPTPVLAFAVRHLDTSAGVMVTASHNPANDNGYKVYLGGADQGSQIVPPEDGLIAAEIARVSAVSITDLPRSTDFIVADDTILDEYVRQTATIGHPAAAVSFVYSAMHGVGWETAKLVFEAAGFGTPAVVTEQIEPDAAFPTVAFPNPEEPGAMDLTLARALEVGADLAIVNDPDADRLAVAVPGRDGVWRRLSGNEVGYLLGWRAAERAAAGSATEGGTLAASIVSSPALRAIAAAYGLDYEDTLTGFKWISRAENLLYGFEEALGYLVDPHIVRDKDGISAAVDFLSLASELKAAGRSIDDHFDDFADRFGAFASSQISLRVDDLSRIAHMMDALRATLPTTIGAVAVDRIDDFIGGFDQYPAGDILRIHLSGGSRVIVRPSGTEPKLKVYIDASSAIGTAAERRAAAQSVVAELDAGMRRLLEA